ncbi:MAG: hypothetical protein P8Z35_13825 [Ignavibacteriaceae bacterium]
MPNDHVLKPQPGISGEVLILPERSREKETLSSLSAFGGDHLLQKSLKPVRRSF